MSKKPSFAKIGQHLSSSEQMAVFFEFKTNATVIGVLTRTSVKAVDVLAL
jgi:hypothetical protein